MRMIGFGCFTDYSFRTVVIRLHNILRIGFVGGLSFRNNEN